MGMQVPLTTVFKKIGLKTKSTIFFSGEFLSSKIGVSISRLIALPGYIFGTFWLPVANISDNELDLWFQI